MPTQAQRWFKSQPVATIGTDSLLDREAGIIRDVILCQVGQAKGHGVELEQDFINDVVDYANQHWQSGLKSRFGHPSMSDTTMGTQLGYFTNFRVRGQQAIADLQLLEAAKNSKNGDMWSWLFDIAEEKPDFVMNSIVFTPFGEYQYDDEGQQMWIWNKESDDYNQKNDSKPVFVALQDLHFADLVENGAATDTLFGAGLNSDKFAVIATEFFNEQPAIEKYLQEHPDRVAAFLKSRGIEIQKTSWFSNIIELFKSKDGSSEHQELAAKLSELQEQATAYDMTITNQSEQINALTTEAGEKDKVITRLQARITELESMSIIEDVTKYKKTPQVSKLPPWHKDNFK